MEDGDVEGCQVNVVDPMKALSRAYENLLLQWGEEEVGSWPNLWPLCRLECHGGIVIETLTTAALAHPCYHKYHWQYLRQAMKLRTLLTPPPPYLQLAHVQANSILAGEYFQ